MLGNREIFHKEMKEKGTKVSIQKLSRSRVIFFLKKIVSRKRGSCEMLWKSPEVDLKPSGSLAKILELRIGFKQRAFDRGPVTCPTVSFFFNTGDSLRTHVDAAVHARLDAGADGLRLHPTASAGRRAIEDRGKKVDSVHSAWFAACFYAIPRSSGAVEIGNSVCTFSRQASRGIKRTKKNGHAFNRGSIALLRHDQSACASAPALATEACF